MNKYTGSLEFDNEHKQLHLTVSKQNSGASPQSNDVKGLRYVAGDLALCG